MNIPSEWGLPQVSVNPSPDVHIAGFAVVFTLRLVALVGGGASSPKLGQEDIERSTVERLERRIYLSLYQPFCKYFMFIPYRVYQNSNMYSCFNLYTLYIYPTIIICIIRY